MGPLDRLRRRKRNPDQERRPPAPLRLLRSLPRPGRHKAGQTSAALRSLAAQLHDEGSSQDREEPAAAADATDEATTATADTGDAAASAMDAAHAGDTTTTSTTTTTTTTSTTSSSSAPAPARGWNAAAGPLAGRAPRHGFLGQRGAGAAPKTRDEEFSSVQEVRELHEQALAGPAHDVADAAAASDEGTSAPEEAHAAPPAEASPYATVEDVPVDHRGTSEEPSGDRPASVAKPNPYAAASVDEDDSADEEVPSPSSEQAPSVSEQAEQATSAPEQAASATNQPDKARPPTPYDAVQVPTIEQLPADASRTHAPAPYAQAKEPSLDRSAAGATTESSPQESGPETLTYSFSLADKMGPQNAANAGQSPRSETAPSAANAVGAADPYAQAQVTLNVNEGMAGEAKASATDLYSQAGDAGDGSEEAPSAQSARREFLHDRPLTKKEYKRRRKQDRRELMDFAFKDTDNVSDEKAARTAEREQRYGAAQHENQLGDYEGADVIRDHRGAIIGHRQTWKTERSDAAIRHLGWRERRGYRLKIEDGLFHDTQGSAELGKNDRRIFWRNQLFHTSEMRSLAGNTTGRAIFVMTADGKVYAADQRAEYEKGDRPEDASWIFHHTSFLVGTPVASAGELAIDKGVLKGITSASGHYQTDTLMLRQALRRFADCGVKLDGVFCELMSPKGQGPGRGITIPAQRLLETEATAIFESDGKKAKYSTDGERQKTISENLYLDLEAELADPKKALVSAQLALDGGNVLRAADVLLRAYRTAPEAERAALVSQLVDIHRRAFELYQRSAATLNAYIGHLKATGQKADTDFYTARVVDLGVPALAIVHIEEDGTPGIEPCAFRLKTFLARQASATATVHSRMLGGLR